MLQLYVYMLVLSVCCLPSLNAATCEDTETSQLKLDLAKKSIDNAKTLYPKCGGETIDGNCTVKDKSLAHLNVAQVLINEANLTCHSCPDPQVKPPPPKGAPIDCSDIQSRGVGESGVYQVWPRGRDSNESMDVYCDMETAGGGWTVFQRRGNYSNQTDFDQDWETYKSGFGDLKEEFWLGNEKILAFTRQGDYSIRMDLVSVDREYAYAFFNSFSIGDEKSDYMLSFVKHGGNSTNPELDIHTVGWENKSRFSTKDHGLECAKSRRSGFWFNKDCYSSNLNGIYKPGHDNIGNMHWVSWKQSEGLYSSEMKIKRKNV